MPKRPTEKKQKASATTRKKTHSWRLCPTGQHWVQTHPMRVPPSKNHPSRYTTRHGHCAHNPSGKDQLYFDEIQEIATRHFSKAKIRPCSLILKFGTNEVDFDNFIAGWTQYWNEVFQPDTLLDPNFVKALIASESGFNPKALANKKNSNSARGLSQITNETRKILGNEKGELKEHFVSTTKEQLNDPNVNICAGVRWLFHKRNLASSRLGRPATWEEAIAEYKSIHKGLIVGKNREKELMDRFMKYLGDYKKCGR